MLTDDELYARMQLLQLGVSPRHPRWHAMLRDALNGLSSAELSRKYLGDKPEPPPFSTLRGDRDDADQDR